MSNSMANQHKKNFSPLTQHLRLKLCHYMKLDYRTYTKLYLEKITIT